MKTWNVSSWLACLLIGSSAFGVDDADKKKPAADSSNLSSIQVRVLPQDSGYLKLEVQAASPLKDVKFSFDGEPLQPSIEAKNSKTTRQMRFRRHAGAGAGLL